MSRNKTIIVGPDRCGSVGRASSHKAKGHQFDSQSGCLPRLLPTRGNLSVFLSHINGSLPLFLPPFSSQKTKKQINSKQTNKKHYHRVLEENIGRKISDIPHSSIFTNMSPISRDIKEIINKWDFIKIKSFCMLKKTSAK